MKKFHNQTRKLQQVEFTDGTVQYLFSGESIMTNKSAVWFSGGVVQSEVEKKTRKKKSSKSDSTKDSQKIDGSDGSSEND